MNKYNIPDISKMSASRIENQVVLTFTGHFVSIVHPYKLRSPKFGMFHWCKKCLL